MSQTAVLVWLSASTATLLPTFRADLDAFARSRLLRLEAPRENAAAFRASAYAPDLVAEVENLLEEARNSTATLEQGRAQAALSRAEQLLREHPELPQSAWLMAEVFELSADVENTDPDGAEAALGLRTRASALQGERAVPFSDRAAGSEPDAAGSLTTQSITVNGLEREDALEWDGIESQASLTVPVGEHHVRVLRNGRLLWAGWSTVTLSESELRLPVPEAVACSSDDLAHSHFEGGRAIAAPNARCDSYVLARARAGGGIEAALCERSRCGNVVVWEHAGAPPVRDERKPVWPYAVAIGAGALAVTGLILWRAGVFDRPGAPTETTLVYNPKQSQMGLRF